MTSGKSFIKMTKSLLFSSLWVCDVLNMMDSEVLILHANSFRTRGWRPLGHGDFNVFSLFSFNATIDGLIVQKIDCLRTSGMSPSGSLVNTEK